MKFDPRFNKVKTDPRFRAVSKRNTKRVPEDERFKNALSDPIFQDMPPVDKYGRQTVEDAEQQMRRMVGLECSQSSSESDASDAGSEGDKDWGEGQWAVNPDEEIQTMDSTHRLAVVDMDWTKITAVELLAAFRSFTPVQETPLVTRVTIYLSEYGAERLPKEDAEGPAALGLFNDEDDGVDSEQLRKYEKSKLRYYYAIVDCTSVTVAEKLMRELDGSEFEASHCCFDLRFVPAEMSFDDSKIKERAETVPDDFESVPFECNALQKTNVQLTWDEDDEKRLKVVRRRFTEDQLQDQDFRAYMGSESEEEDEVQDRCKQLLEGLDNGLTARKGHKTWDLEDGSSEEEEFSDTSNGCLDSMLIQDSKKVQKQGRQIWNDYQRQRSEKLSKQRRRGQFRVDSSASDSDSGENSSPSKPTTHHFFENDQDLKTGDSNAELELTLMDDEAMLSARRGQKLEVQAPSSTPVKSKRRMSRKERIRNSIAKKKQKKLDQDSPDFKVDVEDPRFSKAFTHSDFALDPTDPAFQRTSGTDSLLSKIKNKQQRDSSIKDSSLH